MPESLYLLLAVSLFALGFAALVMGRSLLRRLLALNVMGTGVFMLLIAGAYAPAGTVPGADPVAQALVLTGIVVSISATAFGLSLTLRIVRRGDDESG